MNMILEYLLAGLAAVGLIASAVFAALAELPDWLAYAWAIAVLLAPVGYLIARRFLPRPEPATVRTVRREREQARR